MYKEKIYAKFYFYSNSCLWNEWWKKEMELWKEKIVFKYDFSCLVQQS